MASYIRWEGKARETGTRTQVVDTTHADSEFDAEPGNRWMVICMDHSMLVTSHNLETALTLSAHPLQWCGRCNGSDTEGGQEAPVEAKPKSSRKATNELGLPQKSFEFFKALAEDAPNWSGNPWLDGNVASGRSASGMSQTLVKAGLIELGHDEDGMAYAIFTEAGQAAAAKLGITSLV